MSRTLITICTYNEVDNIRLLIPQLRSVVPEADIVIVDDSSPDGTGLVVAELAAEDAKVKLLSRPKKEGLGRANLAAFRYAMEHGYDRLVNMDADFSHDPNSVPDLLRMSTDCDVVIGSRYVAGGGVTDWTWKRRLMSFSINTYARLLLGLKTRDNSGSFRCYNVAKLAEVDWDEMLATGYAFYEEVLYRCRRVGCRFGETPILFADRRYGVTKINWREAVLALWVIFRLGLQRLTGRRVRLVDDASQPA